jgi:hypothetical protein
VGNAPGTGGATGSGGSKGISVGGGTSIPTAGNTSSGAGTGSSAGGGCAEDRATGMKGESAVVMFLVDLSLSMDERAPGDTQSKLQATIEALNAAVQVLPDGLGVGLTFYPGVQANTMPCFNPTVAVPIAPMDAAQRALLTTAVTGADSDGSTPTHDAYVYALDQLRMSPLQGTKYLVLITDGVPTFSLGCVGTGMPPGVDTAPLVTESGNAYTTDMIKTFVIGSPGSEGAREGLSAMARVGGTGPAGCSDTGSPQYCHFDMTQSRDVEAALTTALGNITQQIPVDCNFVIPPPPNNLDVIDTSRTNVSYNGNTVPYDQSCMTANAWRFDDPAQPEQVIFCGALCDQVKADGNAEVALSFNCTRVDVPR